MADHTSGCAARGVVGFDHDVVSVEFKINFLRPQSPTVYAAGVASSAQARCWLSAKPKCLRQKDGEEKSGVEGHGHFGCKAIWKCRREALSLVRYANRTNVATKIVSVKKEHEVDDSSRPHQVRISF